MLAVMLLVGGCGAARPAPPRLPPCAAAPIDDGVMVMGEVARPDKYPARGATLRSAIAAAGGVGPLAMRRHVVVRRASASGRTAVIFDLDRDDVALCPDDEVDVPRGGD